MRKKLIALCMALAMLLQTSIILADIDLGGEETPVEAPAETPVETPAKEGEINFEEKREEKPTTPAEGTIDMAPLEAAPVEIPMPMGAAPNITINKLEVVAENKATGEKGRVIAARNDETQVNPVILWTATGEFTANEDIPVNSLVATYLLKGGDMSNSRSTTGGMSNFWGILKYRDSKAEVARDLTNSIPLKKGTKYSFSYSFQLEVRRQTWEDGKAYIADFLIGGNTLGNVATVKYTHLPIIDPGTHRHSGSTVAGVSGYVLVDQDNNPYFVEDDTVNFRQFYKINFKGFYFLDHYAVSISQRKRYLNLMQLLEGSASIHLVLPPMSYVKTNQKMIGPTGSLTLTYADLQSDDFSVFIPRSRVQNDAVTIPFTIQAKLANQQDVVMQFSPTIRLYSPPPTSGDYSTSQPKYFIGQKDFTGTYNNGSLGIDAAGYWFRQGHYAKMALREMNSRKFFRKFYDLRKVVQDVIVFNRDNPSDVRILPKSKFKIAYFWGMRDADKIAYFVRYMDGTEEKLPADDRIPTHKPLASFGIRSLDGVTLPEINLKTYGPGMRSVLSESEVMSDKWIAYPLLVTEVKTTASTYLEIPDHEKYGVILQQPDLYRAVLAYEQKYGKIRGFLDYALGYPNFAMMGSDAFSTAESTWLHPTRDSDALVVSSVYPESKNNIITSKGTVHFSCPLPKDLAPGKEYALEVKLLPDISYKFEDKKSNPDYPIKSLREVVTSTGRVLRIVFDTDKIGAKGPLFQDKPVEDWGIELGFEAKMPISVWEKSHNDTKVKLMEVDVVNFAVAGDWINTSIPTLIKTDISVSYRPIGYSKGLLKLVRTPYTNGEFLVGRQKVTANTPYTYQITAMTVDETPDKIVLYDKLEEAAGDYKSWKGSLRSVDVSEITKKGYSAKIYTSASTNPGDLSSGNWKPSTSAVSSNAKAVAVEITKPSGKLASNEFYTVYLNMMAPSDLNQNGYAFNVAETVWESGASKERFFSEKVELVGDTVDYDPLPKETQNIVTFEVQGKSSARAQITYQRNGVNTSRSAQLDIVTGYKVNIWKNGNDRTSLKLQDADRYVHMKLYKDGKEISTVTSTSLDNDQLLSADKVVIIYNGAGGSEGGGDGGNENSWEKGSDMEIQNYFNFTPR